MKDKKPKRKPRPDRDEEPEVDRRPFINGEGAFGTGYQENDYVGNGVRRRHVHDYEQLSEED